MPTGRGVLAETSVTSFSFRIKFTNGGFAGRQDASLRGISMGIEGWNDESFSFVGLESFVLHTQARILGRKRFTPLGLLSSPCASYLLLLRDR